MKTSCIYIINSKVKPERFYIGSAIDLKARISVHNTQLNKGNHHAKKMQRHIDKYGIDDLVFNIIQLVPDKNNLLAEEQKFIDLLKPYFNSRPTAVSNLGLKFGPHKKEHRDKISAGNKGKIIKQSTIDMHKVRMHKYTIDGMLLKTYESGIEASEVEGFTVKTCKGINLTIGGYVWVSDSSELPDFNLIKSRLDAHKKIKCKPVIQINKSGELIAEYEGVRIACKETGIDYRSISQVAAGSKTRKTAGGYFWQYKGGSNER